ncbi:MAG: single-stranded-DNA-specific exonuclease RecJ [Alphaproteobacteria bacterium]|nr:single-stranded-DNA-specific exonuclease RecJ [Alphaproteobacteria bacterium]MDP6237905.1 single-stranded-DNA-specific exonuclease RecJ [Alphaproteobacteria bacterium]MDP7172211.1 single-stranded-DNA-specific exonuclease RecJ [Alphaproteobacteria bacterium]MDP7232914.1 single-stranded-DNA-specific exonuclease RecJ [Alphaproteobacteria bacterium]
MSNERAFLGVERSLGGRRWRSRLDDDRLALTLAQVRDLPEPLARVLAARGVAVDEIDSYLAPSLRQMMPDPSCLKDMDAAAGRLAQAVRDGELIALFGDYDVDGATASAMLRLFLESVGGRVRPYIPDRLREGYGPNAPALSLLAGEGASVVVTLDCGISAHEPLAKATADGMAVIIADHHLAGPSLPTAHAVVNPNRLDDLSGLDMLAAVGVAFMLAIATNRVLRDSGWYTMRNEPDLRQWLDLVALGTICDMVPLVGLNRALVRRGLDVMRRRGNVGLATLADVAGVDRSPDTYLAGFVLGPRINAGGRVGQADLGHRLLTSGNAAAVLPLARALEQHNKERKAIEHTVTDAALREAQALADRAALVVAGEGWHGGVIGLAASRLADRYGRPALVIGFDGDEGKGSARSLPGIDIGTIVTAACQADLLQAGGGHPMAAGFTVARERLGAFRSFVEARVAAQAKMVGGPSLGLDGAMMVGAASRDLIAMLAEAGPYGAGNPEPRFVFPGCQIAHAAVVGSEHVRCRLVGESGGSLSAIAFGTASQPVGEALLAAQGRPLHVAGHLRENRWRDRVEVQMVIDDVANVAAAMTEQAA